MTGKGILAGALLSALCFSNKASNLELLSRSFVTAPATVSAGGSSGAGSYSPDGSRIVFASSADDLLNGTPNFFSDVFILTPATSALQLVSSGLAGAPANGDSLPGNISADNRFVMFQSWASNLVAGDANGYADIFLRDLVDGTTTLISKLPEPVAGKVTPNDQSEYPQISNDGAWVVFESAANNMVAGVDTNITRDIYAWKRADGTLRLVSAAANGKSPGADFGNFTITADNRSVLFEANGTNLVQTGKSGAEIYLRDLEAATTRWVSKAKTNITGLSNAACSAPVISADARYVFFAATPASPTTLKTHLIRVDLNDDTATVITNVFTGSSVGAELYGPTISSDGQFAAWSNGTNIFRWSAAAGAVERVDVDGAAGARASDTPTISHDGRYVAFLSDATNLVADIGGAGQQIYVRDMTAGTTRLVSVAVSGGPATDVGATFLEFSEDGSKLLFETQSPDLVAGDFNDAYDLFSWDVATGQTTLVSAQRTSEPSLTARGSSSAGENAMSDDGRYLAFTTLARLSVYDTNETYDVYLADRLNNTNYLISVRPDGFSHELGSGPAMVTPDGQWVIFESFARGLAGPTDTRTAKNLYARNIATGEMVNISGARVNNAAALNGVSGNSRFVYFTSGQDAYYHDLRDHTETPVATRASVVSASANGSAVAYLSSSLYYVRSLPAPATRLGSYPPLISADGNTLAYRSGFDVLSTNTFTHTSRNVTVAQLSKVTSMDATGRIVAYQTIESAATGPGVVGYIDTRSGLNVVITRAAPGLGNLDGSSSDALVSSDGRFIAFESWASNLVPNDANATKDVFLYDRYLDQISLVSHRANSAAPANGFSVDPRFNRTGTQLYFESTSSDLIVGGDFNESFDLFTMAIEPVTDLTDSDGDGLADAWERAALSALAFGPTDDNDHDGFLNQDEFAAGTDPLDRTSPLRFRAVEIEADGARRFVWFSAPGRHYALEYKRSLEAPAWTQLGADIVATNEETTARDAATETQGFYRLSVSE